MYTSIPLKAAKTKFGTIISNSLIVWHLACQEIKIDSRVHVATPIFYKHDLLRGVIGIHLITYGNGGVD